MQFGHAVGGGALVAEHRDEVAVEFAALERGQELLRVIEHHGGGLDALMLAGHGRYLHDRLPEVPAQDPQHAVAGERAPGGTQHVEVRAALGAGAVGERGVAEHGLEGAR